MQTDRPGGTSTSSPTTTQPASSTEHTTPGPLSLETGETATVGEGNVTVHEVRAQRSIVVLDGSSHTEVVTEDDLQFVVVTLSTGGDVGSVDAARRAATLVVDDQRYAVADHGLPPVGDGFAVAFRVPLSLDASESELRWTEDEQVVASWRTSASVIQHLNSPPSFDVVSFNVPETVEPFTEFDVTVEVENTGDSDGTFVAELGPASRSDQSTFRLGVPKNERVTGSERMQVSGDSGDQETVILDWGLDRLERTIDVVES